MYFDWKLRYAFMDPKTESIFEKIAPQIPNHDLHITSRDNNERYFIVKALNDRTYGTYYLYDAKTENLQKIVDTSPWLKEGQLAEMKPIAFKSRDGLTLHGYLTLPKGKTAKDLPIVVNPHGGPWARDFWRFSPTVQFLANRGYGVLQVNFRGSTGYGKQFWESSFKKWGKEMQNDITDGVQWLIKAGVADKDRICIFGGSYGGYATLAGLAFTPDLYKCGVDYVGVSNIFTLFKTIPPYWQPMREMLYTMVGDPVKDKALLTEISPIFHADKIKAALMVVQGAKDPRVNKAESDQMVEALRKRGIEVPYIVKDNEGHGFHNEENRIEFYSAMEKFLAKHLD